MSRLVSVLMSVFNAEKTIKRCIESILNQSLNDFEFVIINDGSTDNTFDIISSFNDDRIALFNQPHRGLPQALNFGLGRCRGEYIARMDADDYPGIVIRVL